MTFVAIGALRINSLLLKINFLISQPKDISRVLIRTVSTYPLTEYLLTESQFYIQMFHLSGPMVSIM